MRKTLRRGGTLKREQRTRNKEQRTTNITKNMSTKNTSKKQTAAAVTCAGVFYEERSLARVMPWALNPRHDEESELSELKADLMSRGLQDAIHVWERTEGDLILKGHRRFRAMTALGWTSCKQVVHAFTDEAEAFAYLLADHGHTVGLSPEEKVLAVERGVKLGLNTEKLAGPMGISPDRVQMLWDIGEGLPPRGREALHDGRLSLATAEVIVKVEGAKERAKAVQLVLHDVVTQEPLSPGAARNLIESEFILPAKWQKAWTKLEVRLRKELKVADGYHYVPWGERLDYVQGWSGQPQPGYELAEARGARQVQTFGEQAKLYGVPVYVVPAPQHKAEHVLVVSVKMLREAQSAEREAPSDDGDESDERSGLPMTPVRDDDRSDLNDRSDEAAGDTLKREQRAAERLRVWLKTWLGAIFEALVDRPEDVMTKVPWEPLRPFLARLVTNVDAGAFEAWTGFNGVSDVMTWMEADKVKRGYLRQPLMLLMCAACDDDTPDAAKSVVREVAAALGLNGKALDAKVEEALGGE